jgi:hypothetical protein
MSLYSKGPRIFLFKVLQAPVKRPGKASLEGERQVGLNTSYRAHRPGST